MIPEGFPPEVFEKIQRNLKSDKSRALVFQDRGQRSTAFIQKGISKPGNISFDTLRRAALSVHIVRICIEHLKKKTTKTKWVVRNKDIRKRISDEGDKRIKELTEMFRHPNPQDNFRSLLDKMVEDLLVLDAVSLEKTRYPNGELAHLFFVDSATIRPVFNDKGEQDILIPLPTKNDEGKKEELPVSYVQVMNNSQYGGPESGDIVAAWPKKDFIHSHMNPQGAMEAFGYGLSPIESILSVVANILNADNYNGTYFEEGAFPPIVLQLIGQVNQRDLEAYREYLVAELSGNFHRPAIMATEKAESLQIHNLKDINNRDMQFMEYQLWLAKLCCAIYGMSPEDIGLTDTTGSKSVSEVQLEISHDKGYSSLLRFIEELFNENIIWRDFGYDDLEFAFIATDSIKPDAQFEMFDKALRNGTMTLNEVREEIGKAPFDDWADEPMILAGDGYKPLLAAEQEPSPETKAKMEHETEMGKDEEMAPFKDKEKKVEKSQKERTLYINRPVLNAKEIIAWAKSQGFNTTVQPKDMHVTIAFSSSPFDWSKLEADGQHLVSHGGARIVQKLGEATVLRFEDSALKGRWGEILDKGASWDYEGYKPHITLSYGNQTLDLSKVEPFAGAIHLGPELMDEIKEEWAEGITEKMQKAVFTPSGYRCWADDRGYSQPFIWMDVKQGIGTVIKPPVAVNLNSSYDLEASLARELYERGFNVKPIQKLSYVEICNMLRSVPEIYDQFQRYVAMEAEYDSEKWKAKHGGSRKFNFYLVSDYIDGFSLGDPLLIADMKRDPSSYENAVRDLAKLWKVEKEMVLGDRRVDQYIIGHDKRAYGFDYQFAGDVDRWEGSKDAIKDKLRAVPQLLKVFNEEVNRQGIAKRLTSLLRRV